MIGDAELDRQSLITAVTITIIISIIITTIAIIVDIIIVVATITTIITVIILVGNNEYFLVCFPLKRVVLPLIPGPHSITAASVVTRIAGARIYIIFIIVFPQSTNDSFTQHRRDVNVGGGA